MAVAICDVPTRAADQQYRIIGFTDLDQPRVGQFDLLALGRTGARLYDSACSPVNGLAGAIRAAGFA
jgi:hypothetical protein